MGLDFSKFLDDDDYLESPVNDRYENPDYSEDDDYVNLDDEEKREKIRKLKIGNEKELRNLFERGLMVSIMGEVGQSIQNNFVDQAKRRAYIWANELGIPEKERDLEKLIGDLVQDGINGVEADILRLSDEGVFE